MDKVDTTLFIKTKYDDMIILKIYVNNFFCAINITLCQEFSKCMSNEFEISMMGGLKFFLRLQIKQTNDGIFVKITKYQGIIGSLLYLTANRLDIMFNVCIFARFRFSSKESYLNAVK